MVATLADGTVVAHQGGPRPLADDVERAWSAWDAMGAPRRYDYGLTVEPGRQFASAEDPRTGPRWH